MQLKDITPEMDFETQIKHQVIDVGVGKYKVWQRFNDKDTEPETFTLYKTWSLIGHNGLDMTKADGDNNIYAFDDGEVVFADWYYNLGWIEKNYFYGGGIMTFVHNKYKNLLYVYMHLSDNQGINVGDMIKRGDRIGTQGGYGERPNQFDSHLHLGIYDVDANSDIYNLDNGFYGGKNPLPILVELQNQSNNSNNSVGFHDLTYNNNDMAILQDIKNKLQNEPTPNVPVQTKLNIINSFDSLDYGYPLRELNWSKQNENNLKSEIERLNNELKYALENVSKNGNTESQNQQELQALRLKYKTETENLEKYYKEALQTKQVEKSQIALNNDKDLFKMTANSPEAQKRIDGMMYFIRNNIATIATILATLGVTVSQDSIMQFASIFVGLAGFVISLVMSIHYKK